MRKALGFLSDSTYLARLDPSGWASLLIGKKVTITKEPMQYNLNVSLSQH